MERTIGLRPQLRFTLALPVLLLAAAAVSLWHPAPAAACSPGDGDHCYAEVQWDTGGLGTVYDGIQASLFTNNLTVGSGGSHTTSEIWACSAAIAHCPYTDFVEEGWHIGTRFNQSGTALAWFWAEDTFGTDCDVTYIEHYGFNPVAFGQTHIAKLVFGASGFSGFVYMDGTKVGTTRPCHSQTLGGAEAGVEITSNSPAVLSSSNSLTKRNHSTQVWTQSLPGSYLITLPSTAPLSRAWSQTGVSADYWSP